MQVAILETGKPPAPLDARFPGYPAMFADLLGPGFDIVTYDVETGQLPPSPDAHPAYLVTGSPAGVYEDHAWIKPLKAFLRAAKGKAKIVGICFGHQIMAEAFGGKVEKSAHGWRVGLQTYHVDAPPAWMDKVAFYAIPASHQDQVVVPPSGARTVARGERGPYGLFAYEDQPAISFQAHPEFSAEYAKALIETRRARLPDPDAALASLDTPHDGARVGLWIRRFLRDETA